MEPTRIILSGACGRMGRVIADIVSQREDCQIVAGIDLVTVPYADFPIFKDPFSCTVEADVIIDFSNPMLIGNLLTYAKNQKLPLVIATTGFNPEPVEGSLCKHRQN